MVRDDTPAEDALEQGRVTGDRELEPDRWDALHLARLANRRRRAGQRPELLDAGRGPPRGAVVLTVRQRHLARDTLQQRVDILWWHENRDPVHAARTGSALKSFRPCSPRPVRSRDCFRCWEPMRFACGLPGSSQAESGFRSWHVVSVSSCSVAATLRCWRGSGARSWTSSCSIARTTARWRSGLAKGSAGGSRR